MGKFISWLDSLVSDFAFIVVDLLEIVGIIVILLGAFKAIYLVVTDNILKKHHNVKISLGNSLALGLEFKMGAEIIKTVIVKDLSELLILGAIILLRALLAFIIHWEIKTERKDEIDLEELKQSEKK